MENYPFIDDFPIKTSIYSGFSMAMLNNQRVLPSNHADSTPVGRDPFANQCFKTKGLAEIGAANCLLIFMYM